MIDEHGAGFPVERDRIFPVAFPYHCISVSTGQFGEFCAPCDDHPMFVNRKDRGVKRLQRGYQFAQFTRFFLRGFL